MSRKAKKTIKLIHCGNRSIVNPSDQREKNVFFMPMGIFALAKKLSDADVSVEILHSDLLRDIVLADVFETGDVDAVGFDCHWVNQSYAVIEAAREIKRIAPDVFIFVGGFSASFFAREIMNSFDCIDAVIQGDAEVPLVALADVMNSSAIPSSLNEVPNLMWRTADAAVCDNGVSYVASNEDLEVCDFSAIELLRDWEHYRKRSIYWTHFAPDNFAPFNFSPLFFLEIGRGCTNDCLFCGGSAPSQKRINNRGGSAYRTVSAVMRTIEKTMALGFRTFLSDFEFCGSSDWYCNLFESIREAELDIRFVYSAWSLPSEKLIDSLADSFSESFIQLSPETGNDALRSENKKRVFYSNRELESFLDYVVEKRSIKVQLYYGYFLAFETETTIIETLHTIATIVSKYAGIVEICYSNYSTDPASMLYSNPSKYNTDVLVTSFEDYLEYIKNTYIEQNLDSPDMRLFKPRSMTNDELNLSEQRILFFNYLFIAYRITTSHVLHMKNGQELFCEMVKEGSMQEVVDDDMFVVSLVKRLCLEFEISLPAIDAVLQSEQRAAQKRKKDVFRAKPNIWIYTKDQLRELEVE